MANPSDLALRRLARCIRAGDVGAFETLFRSMHAPLCEVVDSYVRSQSVAEELVQDLFAALWIRRAQWRWRRSPRAYLFGAARNRAVQYLRHQAVVRGHAHELEHDPFLAGIARPAVGIDIELDAAEERAAVRRAIDALPPRARLAVVLRWDHGMTNAEAASAMGISVKGVEKLIATAKPKLRALLGERADEALRELRMGG